MTFWTSDPPSQQGRSRRLQFRDGVAAASTPFAASSIGFLPVSSARSQLRTTRAPEQAFFFKPLFRASSFSFPSEATASHWKRSPAPYNADAPIGQRITVALATSGYTPSDAPWRPFQHGARPVDD